MKTKYVNSNGAVIGRKDLPVVVRTLKQIERSAGAITPQLVVACASSKSNPLHKFFTWDDNEAAKKHREWEARMLIRSVSVVFTDSGGQEQSIRAFVSLKPDEDSPENELSSNGYLSVESIGGNGNYESQVIRYAHTQLLGWKKRFGHFRQFIEVNKVIEKVKI